MVQKFLVQKIKGENLRKLNKHDIIPMRNVTATGNSTEGDDFSKWTFTYSQLYQTIKQGANELTAKISCFASNDPTPLSEWHTVNITGVVPRQPIKSPTE